MQHVGMVSEPGVGPAIFHSTHPMLATAPMSLCLKLKTATLVAALVSLKKCINLLAYNKHVFLVLIEPCEWEYERCDECTATCGEDVTKTCYPKITKPAKNGGRPCPPFAVNEVPQEIECEGLPSCPPGIITWCSHTVS